MKILLLLLSFHFILSAAQNRENDWEFKQFNFYFENDLFAQTDYQYSSGEKVSLLYYIPHNEYSLYDLLFIDDGAYDSYITFAIANQIFTPCDITTPEPIPDDRPYAGWTYAEAGIHKSSQKTLQSLYLQIGAVGPASHAEDIQKFIHELTGSDLPQGWDNQLKDELGINLRYIYKIRYQQDISDTFKSVIIPYGKAELGNISIQAIAGVTAKIGWHILQDFGESTINTGGDTGISTYNEHQNRLKMPWSFSLHCNLSSSAIARDIFLDGNTFRESLSIDKKYFVFSTGAGFTARYKRVELDYHYQKHTKHYDTQKVDHGFGSVTLSLLF
jgi:hypothetical protein